MSTTDDHEPGEAPKPARRYGGVAKTVAPIAAALLVGGGVAVAVEHHSSPTASARNTPSAAAGAPAAGGGGVAGEQHVEGTVTAKTSGSVTVELSSGTSATYVVNATSEIARNGQSASLADVKVGDPVFAHVYPSSSGQLLVERLFAGSSATSPGFGPPPASTT